MSGGLNLKAEVLLDVHALLGEGAIWDWRKGVLLWVDIKSSLVYSYDPARRSNVSVNVGAHVGTVVVRQKGGWMVSLREGFASVTEDGKVEYVKKISEEGMRFNDGKCDPAGRFWAGSYGDGGPKMGMLYRLGTDLSCKAMVEDVGCSNGIVWTADQKTMFYIDTTKRRIDRFDYDVATGEIGNRRAAVNVPEGLGWPDGMSIDSEGKLWVAMWGGGHVLRFDPESGGMIGRVEVPGAMRISSVAFGGADLKDMFITSSGEGVDLSQEPHAGSLFWCRSPVAGVRSVMFGG